LIAILLLLIILCISFGAGARLLRLLGVLQPLVKKSRTERPSLAEEFVFAASLGFGVLAYLVLLLGICGLLYNWALAALLLVVAAICWRQILRLLEGILQGIVKAATIVFPYSSIALGLWTALMLLFILIGALAPAAVTEWDGLAYHLAAPKIYLQQHRILPLPWMSHSNFPFSMEMLYLLGLALQGQALAKLLHFGCALLLAFAVFLWAARAFGKGAGVLATAIFASVPLVFWEATVAYNELLFALFCLLSIWAWWRRSEAPSRRWIILSGIFAGLALGTKMLAGLLVVFMLLAIIWRRPAFLLTEKSSESGADKPASGKKGEAGAEAEVQPGIIRALLLWLIPAVLVAFPWYLKSYLWTGNPVYPFFYDVFGGRYWSADLAANYTAAQTKFGMGHGLRWLFALPWTLTMHGRFFYDHPEPNFFNIFVLVFGPLFLALLPAMLWQGRRDSLTRFLLAFCGISLIAWFFLSAQTARYLLPILPVLSIAAAGAILRLSKVGRWLGGAAAAVLGLELAVGIAVCTLLISQSALPVFNIESDKEYLSRRLDIYPICEQINSTLPSNVKIMLLNDTRGFYLDRDYLWGIGHHDLIRPEETATPQALAAAFQRLGVTHLLLSPDVRQSLASSNDPLQRALNGLISENRLSSALEHSGSGFAVLAFQPESNPLQ
jgi:hypothetical protein